ncbi:MAG: hypothetical protein R3C17_03390 [Planctomycetaceae bacterium]
MSWEASVGVTGSRGGRERGAANGLASISGDDGTQPEQIIAMETIAPARSDVQRQFMISEEKRYIN